MDTMKISTLKANGYLSVQSFKNPVYAKNIINYVDFLAANNSICSDDFEIPIDKECEDLKIINSIKVDKQKINEMFFNFLETQKKIQKQNYKLPPSDAIDLLNVRDQREREKEIYDCNSNIDYSLTKIDDFNRRLMETFGYIRECQSKIDMLNNKASKNYGDEIARAIKETNWDYVLYNEVDASVVFINRTDVILRYTDRENGLDYSINCGKYAVKIKIKNFFISLHKTKDTVVAGQIIHPHILRDNTTPCWGNAAETIKQAVLKGDIYIILRVLDSLLCNYNPDSPYIQIEKYKKAADEHYARKAKMHEEEFSTTFEDEGAEEDLEEDEEEEDYEDEDQEGSDDEF